MYLNQIQRFHLLKIYKIIFQCVWLIHMLHAGRQVADPLHRNIAILITLLIPIY